MLQSGAINLSVVKDLRSLLLKHTDDSNASFESVISTLQSLDPLRSPRNVRIRPANPRHRFSDAQIAAFADEMAKHGLRLLLQEKERYTLDYIDQDFGVVEVLG